MIVVIDTNVVVQAAAGSHPFSAVIDGWVDGRSIEDKHFRPLAGAGYKPQPISPRDFIARHLSATP